MSKWTSLGGAADLCATVLLNGGIGEQFAISLENLRRVARLPQHDLEVNVGLAIEQGWLNRKGNRVTLKAAGIYVAKEVLDLPR